MFSLLGGKEQTRNLIWSMAKMTKWNIQRENREAWTQSLSSLWKIKWGKWLWHDVEVNIMLLECIFWAETERRNDRVGPSERAGKDKIKGLACVTFYLRRAEMILLLCSIDLNPDIATKDPLFLTLKLPRKSLKFLESLKTLNIHFFKIIVV